MAMKTAYKLGGITKRYKDLTVYNNFSFVFERNHITSILGPSGCGKTTLLNMIARTDKPDAGKIEGTEGESVSYIFQEPRLLPWKTVRENMLFVLRAKYPLNEACQLTDRFLSLVNLSENAHFYPRQLSGGMRQRLSIARSFAFPSELILMDEPFKGLDFRLKESLIEAFRNLWTHYKRTVLFVTHDIDEALKMAHELVIFTQPPVQEYKRIDLAEQLKGRTIEQESYIRVKREVIEALHCM